MKLVELTGYFNAYMRKSGVESLEIMCQLPGNKLDVCMTLIKEFNRFNLWNGRADLCNRTIPEPTGTHFQGVIQTSNECTFLKMYVLFSFSKAWPLSWADTRLLLTGLFMKVE